MIFLVALLVHLPGTWIEFLLDCSYILRLFFKRIKWLLALGSVKFSKGLVRTSLKRYPSLLTQFILSGQVGGVAISSAIFQSSLEGELRSRIHRPDAEDVRPATQIQYILS